MEVHITPNRLVGAITPPPSKSMAHRVVLAQTLAGMSPHPVTGMVESQDIQATKRSVQALIAAQDELPLLDCGESGSTLRFLIPIALAVAGGGIFIGHGRLMERPQTPYKTLFTNRGIQWTQTQNKLVVQGTLSAGRYELEGNISSQFVTGLLYALPLLNGESELILTTELESKGYVNMTLQVLRQFGIAVEYDGKRRFVIAGNQTYMPKELSVEADWSQAAFWYAANFLNNRLSIQGLTECSTQGDRVVASLFQQMAQAGTMEIDVSDCPDLLPPLAVMAAVRRGTTHFIHAARLRMKESDRLLTTASMLHALGVMAEEGVDTLTVIGQPVLYGGTVDGANDHRIVMATAIAATVCNHPVTILGAEAVQKSYPTFWEEYRRLGGEFHVL